MSQEEPAVPTAEPLDPTKKPVPESLTEASEAVAAQHTQTEGMSKRQLREKQEEADALARKQQDAAEEKMYRESDEAEKMIAAKKAAEAKIAAEKKAEMDSIKEASEQIEFDMKSHAEKKHIEDHGETDERWVTYMPEHIIQQKPNPLRWAYVATWNDLRY